MTQQEGICFDDNAVYITMCPPTRERAAKCLGVSANGCTERRRSNKRELSHSMNRCLLTIGEGITNIGDDVT